MIKKLASIFLLCAGLNACTQGQNFTENQTVERYEKFTEHGGELKSKMPEVYNQFKVVFDDVAEACKKDLTLPNHDAECNNLITLGSQFVLFGVTNGMQL